MPIYQAFNSRIGAWVKYEFVTGQGLKITDVKQQEPLTPFKHIPKRGKRR